jgi:hypothetical protein
MFVESTKIMAFAARIANSEEQCEIRNIINWK